MARRDGPAACRDSELDLVEVARWPVNRWTKLRTTAVQDENAQKAPESRRTQTNTVIKEMKPPDESQPRSTNKKGNGVRFLKPGTRSRSHHVPRSGAVPSRAGYNLLKKLAADVDEFGYVESSPKQDGRNMLMVLGPHKKKTEAKADVRAERDRRAAEREADAEAERVEQADRRAQHAAEPVAKRRRGPADNLDSDVDLN